MFATRLTGISHPTSGHFSHCFQEPEIRLASVSFRPPATLMDAVLFFQSASVPYDGSGEVILFAMRPAKTDEIYPPAPELTAEDISFYDALRLLSNPQMQSFGFVATALSSWNRNHGYVTTVANQATHGSWTKAVGQRPEMGNLWEYLKT